MGETFEEVLVWDGISGALRRLAGRRSVAVSCCLYASGPDRKQEKTADDDSGHEMYVARAEHRTEHYARRTNLMLVMEPSGKHKLRVRKP